MKVAKEPNNKLKAIAKKTINVSKADAIVIRELKELYSSRLLKIEKQYLFSKLHFPEILDSELSAKATVSEGLLCGTIAIFDVMQYLFMFCIIVISTNVCMYTVHMYIYAYIYVYVCSYTHLCLYKIHFVHLNILYNFQYLST